MSNNNITGNGIAAIIDSFADKAKNYINNLDSRRVFPGEEALKNVRAFDIPLQDQPMDASDVLGELHRLGSPATVASTGGRYFGFVIGGSLPAALGANLLAGIWDQNAGLDVSSPVSSLLETVSGRWLNELLGLPPETEAGFVTGATMANFTCLAAARHELLSQQGWNVEEDGLFGAPPITVIVGDEVHVSLLKALSMVGFGRKRVIHVPVDTQGRMRPEAIPDFEGPAIICIQEGNVNTGAFDPALEIIEIARRKNAWVHVDGAFGLWARASGQYRHLTTGLENADSWATDAHKWLNVPYDSGIAFVRNGAALTASMSQNAAYLARSGNRTPFIFVPEMSRRSRGVEIWAALRALGKNGLEDLINRNCKSASDFAERLKKAGFSILNDVVLNQVLVSFGNADVTNRIIRRIQDDGTCWCGGTVWQNHTAMRISVSSWKTSDDDIEMSAEAIIRIASEEMQHPVNHYSASDPIRSNA